MVILRCHKEIHWEQKGKYYKFQQVILKIKGLSNFKCAIDAFE